MRKVAAIIAGLLLAGIAAPALACSVIRPASTEIEQLRYAMDSARLASTPTLAAKVREAADITLITVAAVESDRPDDYYTPVRYTFAVERTLKGQPVTSFPLIHKPDLGGRVWPARPQPEDVHSPPFHDAAAWWHTVYLAYGLSVGSPGDCSSPIAFATGQRYLAFRDAGGMMTAAEPVTENDLLIGVIEAMIADPDQPYPYRPTVAEYLALQGGVFRLRITNCDKEQAKVTEVIRQGPPGSAELAKNQALTLSYLVPALRISECRKGEAYLVTGWPHELRLHPIEDEDVLFEERWMQLRFKGSKIMPLAEVRAIAAR